MKYALIENNTVANVIEWDGESPYQPDGNPTLINIDGQLVDIGYSYIDGEFQAPPIVEPTPEN